MSKATLGRSMAKALLQAMGLPADRCVSVDIDLPVDGFATMTPTYHLRAEDLAEAAKLLQQANESSG